MRDDALRRHKPTCPSNCREEEPAMFKKFTVEENVSSTSQIKNSVQRGIQAAVISQYPALEPIIDELLPKKAMVVAKCQV